MPGKYYLQVKTYSGDGTFRMKATFHSAGTNEKEWNNGFANAMAIKSGALVKAQLAKNDDVDFFKFRVPAKTEVIFKFSSNMDRFACGIYDQDGGKVDDFRLYSDDNGVLKHTYSYELEAGLYYIKISRASSYLSGVTTGAYDLKVLCPVTLGSKNVSLSKTKYEYDGKVKSPAVIVKDNHGKKLVKGRYLHTRRCLPFFRTVKVVYRQQYGT